MNDEEKALEAKKSAFFEKLPDPPANAAVVEEADAPAPKDAPGAARSETATTKDAPARSTASSAKASTSGGSRETDQRPVVSDAATQPDSSDESPKTPEADQVSRIVKALREGDLDALADLTEQDPALFDEKSTKWAARNRRESKLKAEVAAVRADAKAIVDHYAPIDEKLETYQKTKDPAAAAALFELLTGEALVEVASRLSVRGTDSAASSRPSSRAAEKALVEALRDDLPDDHQVRALPDWESQVVAVLRESADENDGEPELSFRQAAARVVRREKERFAKLAKVYGAPPAPGDAKPKPPERAGGTAPSTKRKLTRDEFFAAFDAQK